MSGLAGCGNPNGAEAAGTSTETAEGASEAGDARTDPATGLRLADCGNAAYQLVPRSDVGALVDFDDAPRMSWSALEIDAVASVLGAPFDPVPHGAKMHRFRYTTQDRGEIVEATGALVIPDGGAPVDASLPTLLWLHGTSGWSDACSPSNDPILSGQAAIFAAHGYIVVAPDFIGLSSFGGPSLRRHPWLLAEPTALATWDALPAATDLMDHVGRGVVLGQQVVLMGPSQGGHAALFAERYGQYYAPEHKVLAQVALVPASSITRLMEYVADPSVSRGALGVLPPIFPVYGDWYGRQADLGDVFTDVAPHNFASRADEIVFGGDCSNDVEFVEAIAPGDVFVPSFLEAARTGISTLEPWGCYAAENSIVTTPNPPLHATTPTLFTVGENDEIVPGMDADASDLCDLGYAVELLSCAGANHFDAAVKAGPRALRWIADRVAGVPVNPEETCVVREPVCCDAQC